jgi:hypothetical protein
VEGAAIMFAWFAFDWKVAMLVLLMLWCLKVSHKFSQVDK